MQMVQVVASLHSHVKFQASQLIAAYIDLVELMWKVVAEILNLRITASITFHDFLHGFWSGCGTGTATPKSKLIHQLAALGEEFLYVIFLYLHKAYDALVQVP